MNLPRSIQKVFSATATSAIAILMCASCASTVQTRIEKNPQVLESLSSAQRTAAEQGKITKGMPKGAVFIAWGKPDRVSRGNRDGKAFETWRYNAYQPVHTQSVGIHIGSGYGHGYGHGRYGRYGWCPDYSIGSDIYYRPYTAARVDFSNERVTSWETLE